MKLNHDDLLKIGHEKHIPSILALQHIIIIEGVSYSMILLAPTTSVPSSDGNTNPKVMPL